MVLMDVPLHPSKANHSRARSPRISSAPMGFAIPPRKREVLKVGTPGDGVDGRSAPSLESKPLAGAIAKDFQRAHGLRDHASDPDRLCQWPLNRERQSGDAADPCGVI